MIAIVLSSALFLVVCVFQHSKHGFRVLMYHKLSDSNSDKLTVKVDVFEKQLLYIKKHNYQPITLEQLIQYHVNGIKLPKKPILITFDDGYENNYRYLYPLLKKHKLKATIFLPVGFIGKSNSWDEGGEEIMSATTLKEMDPAFVEFGLHSFLHVNYSKITEKELIQDIVNSKAKLLETAIPFTAAVAYPYGSYPRQKDDYAKFTETLKNNEILFGFRIGNKINKLPLADAFSLKRIDIKGTDSFLKFKIKILLGRTKAF